MFHVNDNEGCRLIWWGCLWKSVGYDLFFINKVRHIPCFHTRLIDLLESKLINFDSKVKYFDNLKAL